MPVLEDILDEKKIAFKQVLFATDFSDASTRALAFALAIARRYSAALLIVHAVPPEPRDPTPLEQLPSKLNRRRLEAEQEMMRLAEEAQIKDLPLRLLVDRGRIWDVLGSVIQCEHVDLLVMGSHGRGGLKKAVLGSVAEQVLRLAPCPVLTIGPCVATGPEAVEFRRILFATDFGAAANRAFPYALSLAEDYQAKLVFLHMVAPMSSGDFGPVAYGPSAYGAEEYLKWQRRMQEDSANKLKKLIPPNAKLASEPEYVAGVDFLAEGILETAAAHKVDLIVMGANRTSFPRLAAHIPWALTHEVLRHARCPVLTISD